MQRLPVMAWLAAAAALLASPHAEAQNRATYENMVAVHAHANQVPEALVHRVIVRESKYRPDLVGRGGTIGLMQIKLATARGLGYTGDAQGLRDPETNLTYGVKYLAGAYRAAESNHDRAVHLYASGYYEVAKRQRQERTRRSETMLARAPPKEAVAEPNDAVAAPKEAPAAPAEPPAATEPGQAAAEPAPDAVKPKSVTSVSSASRTRTPLKTVLKPIDLVPSFLKPRPVSKTHSKPAAK